MYSILNTVACTIALVICKSSALSVPFVTDEQFKIQKQSSTGAGILLIHKTDRSEAVNDTVQALAKAAETLKSHGTKVGILNCRDSKADECQEAGIADSILLYKNGEFITNLQVNMVKTQSEAEGQILHWLNWEKFEHVKSVGDWKNLRDACFGKRNILFAFFDRHGSELHGNFIKAAIESSAPTRFAYTTNPDLAAEIMSVQGGIDGDGAVWGVECLVGAVNGECIVREYLGAWEYLLDFIEDLDSARSAVIGGEKPSRDLQMLVAESHRQNLNVLLFVAGRGKLEKATSLAAKSCALLRDTCFCAVVDGSKYHRANSEIIENGRIHLSIVPVKQNNDAPLEPGFLLSETVGEVNEHWTLYLAASSGTVEDAAPEKESDENVGYENYEEGDEVKPVEEDQDDPVAFSVHSSKALVDLYLYDFKTIERLTDVTFERLVASDKYAAVLFTIEFNAKALAALSIIVNVHKNNYAPGTSPFYRVECFDWPDVCAKMGIVTYPRLFFYLGGGEDRASIEYKGPWDEAKINQAVTIYSLPRPFVIDSYTKIENLTNTIPVLVGLTTTDAGIQAFTTAARRSGTTCLFVLPENGAVAKEVVKSLGVKNWNGKDILFGTYNGESDATSYKTAEDVDNFLASMESEDVVELTGLNFDKVLGQNKPVLIQYYNSSRDNTWARQQQKLLDVLRSMVTKAKFSSKVVFSWMDSSPGSAGEHTLYMHSGGENLNVPLAFFDKKEGTVSITSFHEQTKESAVAQWIDSCLRGKEQISYELRKHEWKGRLPGYNFLEMMKKDGTYPTPASAPGGSRDEQEEPPKSARVRGRRRGHGATGPAEEQQQQQPPPKHTEL